MAVSIKYREILFSALHPDPQQARTACHMLQGLEGIHLAEARSASILYLGYDLQHHCLEDIENLLHEVGFHLDNNLLVKLKRALYKYSEENERINLGCGKGNSNCTRNIYIKRYQHLPHGCRDNRPDHWRNYL